MKKKIIIFAVIAQCFIGSYQVSAQSKIHFVTDIHYLYGLSETNSYLTLTRKDVNLYGKSLHLTSLYDFSKSISAGVGIGADRYENPGFNTLPVFASLYYTPFVITHPRTYLFTNLGFGIKNSYANSGLMFDAGIGYKKMFSSRFGLNFQLGYNLKQINETPIYIPTVDNQSYDLIYVTSLRHSLSLGIGVIF
ncbi:MAG TPA: hypothetical protein VFC36_02530 [Paludibacter sp.]|nr:hypothetical protein [Paludibacter sp.]